MSKKSTNLGQVTAVPAPDDAGAGNASVIVVPTTNPVGLVPPPSITQVNSSLVRAQSAPIVQNTGAYPKAQDSDAVGNKPRSIPSAPEVRRNPVREVRRKLDFHCQLCSNRDSDQMVQCDGCKQWFHYECVEVTDDVANVSWICPICNTAKDSTPTAINPPTSANTNQSHHDMTSVQQQRQGEPTKNNVGAGRPKSNAGSGRSKASSARRMKDLELQQLNDEHELEKKFLKKRYTILKEYGSETSSIVSDREKMSKIEEWVKETERHGEEIDSGLVDEDTNGHASNKSKQPLECQTPGPTQSNNQRLNHPDQPGPQSQRAPTHRPSSIENRASNIPSMNPGTLVDGNDFIPGQRSTPLHRPAVPPLTVNDETVCILNRSQLAARQAVSEDLPEFSGNPEDWPLFFSIFNSSTQMCGFSNEENMLRLRKCLKGKALEAVRCRLLHPSNVIGVMSTLKMLYGRPEAIVQAIIRKIRSLPPPNMEKLETVINFALTVENLVATIQACEVSDFVYNSSLRYELIERLPSSLKMDWARFSRGKPSPTLIDFSAWLYTTAEDASTVMIGNNSSEPRGGKTDGFLNFHSESESISGMTETAAKAAVVIKEQCAVCKGNCPSVTKCKRFEEFSYESKWATVKECKLCRKCLRKHNGSCKQSKPCGTNGCEFLHHPLFHNTQKHEASRSVLPQAASYPNTKTEPRTDHSCNIHQGQSEIMFRIVPVMLYGPTKTIRTYAFVDDGSELTLMEQSLADELGVQGPIRSLCLRWTGGTQKMSQSQQVNLQISGVHSSKRYELSGVYTMSSLQIRPQTLLLPELQKRYPYLEGLPLEAYNDISPRILLGLDHARLGHAVKSREGHDNEPIAVKTRLGWMVFGNCSNAKETERYVNYHSVKSCECNKDSDEDLHKMVKSYFSLDSLGVVKPDKLLMSQQDQRAQMLLETHTRRTSAGRYESALLWKYDNVRLPDSGAMALKRWRCLENRMKKDHALADAIKSKIDDHVSKGYVRKLNPEELQISRSRVWYLPIFPVVNPNKPGKMRLVWDAAATVHGVSLNTFLLKGPDQLTSLFSVLVQFREFRVAVSGDIREMFHQVLMRVEDQHCLRFFWKDDDRATQPSIFVVQVMTFGACCSPSTAQYVKNSNAKRFERDYPEAVDAIVKRHYVDDMLVSVESAEEAIQLVQDVKRIHTSAGFEMRNWISNSDSVLAAISEKTTKEKNLDIGDECATEKVLGMWWDTSNDCFTCKVSARYDQELMLGNRRPTKREVLRTLMMVFDPLGLIAHILMFLKVLLQEIRRTTVGWDDPIEDPQYDKWLSWLAVFPRIATIEVPRCYRTLAPVNSVVQMHTFVDASENGFAATVYLRFENYETVECALVGAKTRVAPLKFLSIPRSELQAAVIGVRLADSILKSLSIHVRQRTFWTDSKDVLCWIRSDHRRFSQFVAFRISEILETTDVVEWRWVPTKHNVADEGTKWKRAPDLASNSRWFRGPEFLRHKEEDWPVDPFSGRTTEEELRPHLLIHSLPSDPPIRTQNFSKWSKLLRVTGYVLRYINNLKRSCYGKPRVLGPLQKQDFIDAENHLYRCAQLTAFAEETAILAKNRSLSNPVKTISRSSLLYQWCAFLDENDVLRVKGRTKACAFIARDAAEPVILPRDHHVTRLIISSVHERFNHQNHETVINEILQRYRIPRLKAAYRQIRKDCQMCKILLAKPHPPAMGDLPPARLAAFSRPFTHMGIDYFGPISVSSGRRIEKRWGVIATCLTTRAIHLQIAYTLTTESCVMAIRNIMVRRGIPAMIYSDRGTNFRAASKELQSATAKIDHDALKSEFVSSNTEWSFNPPITPHMGGAWERLIRSVKQNLEAMQTSRHPTHEVLENTLIEIENIVNSRPLTNIPVDGDDHRVLTPNHFLLGSANGLKSWVTLDDSPVLLRNSWRHSQVLADTFWKQWVRDYLPTITRRTKWFTPVNPIMIGDLVIIVDSKLPRNCWLKGRVIATCPAPDSQVRKATVQTASGGIYERPAVSLAVLDVGVGRNTLHQEPSRIPGGSVGYTPSKCTSSTTANLHH
ncbi:uncharacterized protein LOC128740267 [Sabethes cyaneus]|uniref:uncharacterized protein LOC128740267 n=1 Tax=Sabethes cyaneus TaxID=53552 RepID=UPI00237D5DAB|nr:uncharacterized protein LOC128740267 [Sabethes cyaneus]